MKFCDWLRQNDFLLNILVTRHLGYWGYQCLICRERREGEVKDTLLYQVAGPLDESGSIPKFRFRKFWVLARINIPRWKTWLRKLLASRYATWMAIKAMCWWKCRMGL